VNESTNAPHGSEVHRLVDIEVQEVSLVNRAANKHRFLIVKRSNDMEDMTSQESEDNEVTDMGSEPDEDDAGWDDNSTGTDKVRSEALAVSVEALGRLTEAVELLGTHGAEDSPRLTDLAAELHRTADALAALVGGSSSTMASGLADDTLAAFLGSVEQALAQSKRLLEKADPPRPMRAKDAASDKQTPTSSSTPSTPTSPTTPVAKDLAPLVDAVRALTGSVSAQQQRLARLEKQHGLPNSRPPGERPASAHKDDTGWPLNMNKPFDRASVDKSISFHDV